MTIDVLVVEDEEVLARSIVSFLERRGFSAGFSVDARTALVQFQREMPRLVILDYRLGRDNGLDLLSRMRAVNGEATIVIMTGHGDVGIAVEAMKRGARDFLVKPAPLATIAGIAADLVLQEAAQRRDLRGADRLVGRSSAAVDLRAAVRRLSQSGDVAAPPGVLIVGPVGSGKMLVAQALHETRKSAQGEVVSVDCSLGADPEAALAQAGRGTMVMRNVDALGTEQQVRLVQRLSLVGDAAPWLISTTSANLAALERRGCFRTDLLYRLQVGWIEVPPLCERSSDILPLAEEFARRTAARYDRPRLRLSAEARVRLLEHSWPGNIAELENCMGRAVLNAHDGLIDADDIQIIVATDDESESLPSLTKMEETALTRALKQSKGNVSKAALMLGISRDTMRYRMEKFGLSRN